jgi:hypothetical protein
MIIFVHIYILLRFLINIFIVYINSKNNTSKDSTGYGNNPEDISENTSNDNTSEDISENTNSDDEDTPRNVTKEENTPTEDTYLEEEDLKNALNKAEKSLSGDDSGLDDLEEEFPSYFADASSKEEALQNIKDYLESELLDLKFGQVNLNEANDALDDYVPPDIPESDASSSAEPPSPSVKRKRSSSLEDEELPAKSTKNAKIDDDYSTSSMIDSSDMKSIINPEDFIDYILVYLGPINKTITLLLLIFLIVR